MVRVKANAQSSHSGDGVRGCAGPERLINKSFCRSLAHTLFSSKQILTFSVIYYFSSPCLRLSFSCMSDISIMFHLVIFSVLFLSVCSLNCGKLVHRVVSR